MFYLNVLIQFIEIFFINILVGLSVLWILNIFLYGIDIVGNFFLYLWLFDIIFGEFINIFKSI